MRLIPGALLCAAFASSSAMAYSLSKVDSARLAMYQANGEKVVVLTVAARKGASNQVAALVKQLGGRVDYRHDKVDFLAVVLPSEKVAAFLATAPVDSVDVDNLKGEYKGTLEFSSAQPSVGEQTTDQPSEGNWQAPAGSSAANWPPKLGAYNLEHPHSVMKDLGGENFLKLNPGNDGRGVVITHVEWFPDFLSPELQIAYDKQGRQIPKFADVINVAPVSQSLDADAPREGEMWTTRLSKPIKAQEGRLIHNGVEYRTPKSGSYRVAQFDIAADMEWATYVYPLLIKTYPPAQAAEAQKKQEQTEKTAQAPDDKQADKEKEKKVIPYAVLWSDAERTVWLDLNGNKDFSDEQGVKEYKISNQFGVMGVDDPATPARETIGYSVQKDGDYIGINVGFGGHASVVAGAAAANRGTVGRVDGVAPGAQLIALHCCSNDTMSSYAKSLVIAFTDPRTDVVLIEGHSQITGNQYELRDGRSALAIVLGRLVDVYQKPAFMTAGNAPGMTTIMDTTIPDSVISVGAYQSAESVFNNHAIKTKYADDLHWVGSEGPSGLGALKPDLISPANPMTLQPWFRVRDNRMDGVYELPPGYSIGGGTSTATPVATGAAALLVGAAKREGLPTDAKTIHRAFKNSARFIPHFQAYKQGRGVIQLEAAWKYLQAEEGKRVEDIQVAAPVRTATSARLEKPNIGTGLFEREGWRVGDRATRTLTLTRKSGASEPLTYNLSWEGEQKAFTTATSVTLPLNQPVKLKIDVAPTTVGVHSSILHLKRDGMPGALASIPATVVVPYEFTTDENFVWTEKFELDRPGRRNIFFRVPEKTQAYTVSLKTPRDKVVMQIYTPDNRIQRSAMIKEGVARISLDEPMSGVWQIVVSDRGDMGGRDWNVPPTDVLPATPVTVQAAIESVSATLQGDSIQFENRLAGFTGGAARTALGGLRTDQKSIKAGQTLTYDIQVEEGAELLLAQVDRVSGAQLDVDLHLFDCTGEKCVTARRADWNDAHERALVEKPSAGKWQVLLVATGKGECVVKYQDIYTHPKLGALNVADVRQTRKPGESWQGKFNAWKVDAPKSGYSPVGVIWVQAEEQAITRGAPYGGKVSYEMPLGLQVISLQ